MKIDLNCDLGESFGAYKIGNDEEVIRYVHRVNIACGFHAGDPVVMDRTVQLAKENGVIVGAHPGYRDLAGFGRRFLAMSVHEIENEVLYQIGALAAFCAKHNVKMDHVKPHGALYNYAADNYEVARAIAKAIKDFDPSLKMIVLYNSEMEKAAEDTGLNYLREAFADRHYDAKGRLVSRSVKGSVITDIDIIKNRVRAMIMGGMLESFDGTPVKVKPDTICVHGDNAHALEVAKALKELIDNLNQ